MSSLIDQGLAHHDAGDLDRAEWCYRAAAEQDGVDPEPQKLLALVAMERGFADAAVGHIEKAMELAPRDAQYRHLFGRIRAMQGRTPEAVEALRAAADLAGPARYPILCDLGLCLEQLQAWEDALVVYAEVLGHDPHNITALHGKAGACAAVGELPRAKATYEELLRFKPDDSDARSGLAQVEGWIRDKVVP
ncbi:MAG: tetratricopeptide repeat protein [Rhodospirillaceae bacterium]|nr:tetratricopeptide repeat protein [Rhodospirillaceae bacterium]